MKLVVDANVIFSALLKDGKTRELLLDDRLEIFAPLFIKEEILKYKSYLSKKSGHNQEELILLINRLISLANIKFIDPFAREEYINVARRISPDPKDVPYIATALFQACPLWSNDRKLKERQAIVKVITTKELHTML